MKTMSKKPILCLDFDGVIHSYKSGWKGARNIPDPPVDDALEFIFRAQSYFQVHIYSSRSHQWGGRRAIKRWLYNNYLAIAGVRPRKWFLGPFGIVKYADPPKWYYDAILPKTSMEPWEHEIDYGVRQFLKKIELPRYKPAAMVSIDDRCLTFDGNWPSIEKLREFKPWSKS